jgi:hypothetical protein
MVRTDAVAEDRIAMTAERSLRSFPVASFASEPSNVDR